MSNVKKCLSVWEKKNDNQTQSAELPIAFLLIFISVQWQSPSVSLPYEQWQLISSQRSYTFNFIVISFLNEAKHSIKNAFKLINQPPTHLQASYCCYVSNVLERDDNSIVSERISRSDLAKATNEVFFFISFKDELQQTIRHLKSSTRATHE